MLETAFEFCFQMQLAPLHLAPRASSYVSKTAKKQTEAEEFRYKAAGPRTSSLFAIRSDPPYFEKLRVR